jgi:hypothetical protein
VATGCTTLVLVGDAVVKSVLVHSIDRIVMGNLRTIVMCRNLYVLHPGRERWRYDCSDKQLDRSRVQETDFIYIKNFEN